MNANDHINDKAGSKAASKTNKPPGGSKGPRNSGKSKGGQVSDQDRIDVKGLLNGYPESEDGTH